jgi:glyoxylase-like metal-dependent hydrolase (beta-lactamase superfamily II)/ketosteroid isomerase-like protein
MPESAELIGSYLDAVIRKDRSAVARYFDADVEYVVNGTTVPDPDGVLPPLSEPCRAALPWTGLYRGRAAVEGFLAHMHRNLDVVAFGPRDVVAEGNKGAAFGWFRLRARPTGRTADISYAILFELREGRFVKYHFLENTFDVAAAFRAGGSWLMNTDGALHRVPSATSATMAPGSAAPESAVPAEAALTVQPFVSTEPGAWSNAYLVRQGEDALLFDVPMLRADADRLASMIADSGCRLSIVMISHAHPDHFLGLDVIAGRFPQARLVTTGNVAADLQRDGPGIFALLKGKLGAQGPERLVVPDALTEPRLRLGSADLEVVEFGEGEGRHMATVYLPGLKALLCADLVYHDAHLYLAERHPEAWLERLDELEQFAAGRVSAFYPGHGATGDGRLIADTRAYLHDFLKAIEMGDAAAAERELLAKYPGYRVKQFLTLFSLPAYFPARPAS